MEAVEDLRGETLNTQRFRILTEIAVAYVVAARLTALDPTEARFCALCKDLAFCYMLYRAVQYPDLRACPLSLRHLVMNWYGGLAANLLAALKVPDEIVEVACAEMPAGIPAQPRTLGEVLLASRLLAEEVFGSDKPAGADGKRIPALGPNYRDLHGEIRSYRSSAFNYA